MDGSTRKGSSQPLDLSVKDGQKTRYASHDMAQFDEPLSFEDLRGSSSVSEDRQSRQPNASNNEVVLQASITRPFDSYRRLLCLNVPRQETGING